jgi:TRAP transporter 4TM/12TM fusion protein
MEGPDTRLNRFWNTVVIVFTVGGLLLTLNRAFFWNPFGFAPLRQALLYYVLAFFLSLVFLIFPAHKGATKKVPWYDALLFLATVGINVYFAQNTENIINFGWDYAPPTIALVFSFLQWALVLEALRRTAGLVVTIVALLFSAYPMVAGRSPIGFLRGIEFDLRTTAQIHVLGVDSILGLPLQAAAAILIGFLFFGVVLQHTGGANFFYELAQSIFGHARGGAAKVCIVSSASMGMMSGSAVSNVLTTGPMTIPAMKRAGFPGKYAAGVEATASSGGSITPPIMGSAAFLMVSFLGVSYTDVALAAAIPALLYYIGIYVQVDAYASKVGLRGIPRAQLPDFVPVLRKGWHYLAALAGLVFLLVQFRNESQAPFQIAAVLIVIAALKRTDRLTLTGLRDLFLGAGKTIAEILGIIAGVGLIVGGLSMTGVSLSLARELVSLVGGSVILILIAGAITSFVLGMGMTVSAVYVFLAIVMAPALIALGVNPLAAHLFVIYWATVSYITPPVALASFAAAGIAKTPAMATSLTAMRLGMVKYVIPFAFALNPAVIGQAAGGDVAFTVVMSIIGVVMMASCFEGWLVGVHRRIPLPLRVVGGLAGVAVFAPETISSLLGLGVVVAVVAVVRLTQPRGADVLPPEVDEDADAGTTDAGTTDAGTTDAGTTGERAGAPTADDVDRPAPAVQPTVLDDRDLTLSPDSRSAKRRPHLE